MSLMKYITVFHKHVDIFATCTNVSHMPVVAVNLSASVFGEIRRLVEKTLYTSPEQFLEIAAFNQVALERGQSPEEIVKQGHLRTPAAARVVDSTAKKEKQARQRAERPAPIRASKAAPKRGADDSLVRDVLAKLTVEALGDTLPQPRAVARRPETERVWGQVNRLFPMKFACRWLAVSHQHKDAWTRYDEMADTLANAAALMSTRLGELDARTGNKRDELLATGMPRMGNTSSRDRFLSQFVARTTRAGDIYPGAICQYAIAEFDGDRLALTDRGVVLAALANPTLDSAEDPTTTLSDEERDFFVQQVLEYVPGEKHDCLRALAAVSDGIATPDTLLASLRAGLPQEWSDLMVRTHTAGLVARLADMGLLRRHWEGRNVTYQLTQRASALLKQA